MTGDAQPRAHDRTDRYAEVVVHETRQAQTERHRAEQHQRDRAAAYRGARLLAQAERMVPRG
jgi:hypothetical protein